jgi:hypothetical protein
MTGLRYPRSSTTAASSAMLFRMFRRTRPASSSTFRTARRQREKPYAPDGTPQPDGTFKNAVLRTPLFTLKAPRVRILQAGDLVKIQVLARVKE